MRKVRQIALLMVLSLALFVPGLESRGQSAAPESDSPLLMSPVRTTTLDDAIELARLVSMANGVAWGLSTSSHGRVLYIGDLKEDAVPTLYDSVKTCDVVAIANIQLLMENLGTTRPWKITFLLHEVKCQSLVLLGKRKIDIDFTPEEKTPIVLPTGVRSLQIEGEASLLFAIEHIMVAPHLKRLDIHTRTISFMEHRGVRGGQLMCNWFRLMPELQYLDFQLDLIVETPEEEAMFDGIDELVELHYAGDAGPGAIRALARLMANNVSSIRRLSLALLNQREFIPLLKSWPTSLQSLFLECLQGHVWHVFRKLPTERLDKLEELTLKSPRISFWDMSGYSPQAHGEVGLPALQRLRFEGGITMSSPLRIGDMPPALRELSISVPTEFGDNSWELVLPGIALDSEQRIKTLEIDIGADISPLAQATIAEMDWLVNLRVRSRSGLNKHTVYECLKFKCLRVLESEARELKTHRAGLVSRFKFPSPVVIQELRLSNFRVFGGKDLADLRTQMPELKRLSSKTQYTLRNIIDLCIDENGQLNLTEVEFDLPVGEDGSIQTPEQLLADIAACKPNTSNELLKVRLVWPGDWLSIAGRLPYQMAAARKGILLTFDMSVSE